MTATDQGAAHDTLNQLVADALTGEYGPAQFATPGEVLAVLLDGGGIREERGVRVTWPDGHAEDMWGDDRMASGRTLSEYRYEFHNSDQTQTSAERIRRFVVVTAPTVVEETP